ncbi:copia-type polyprotein, partial [Trifolium medium]|nr:copia-type polyprotein [Trifolium medium]
MSANRMFILFNKSSNITASVEKCLYTSSELTYLWHQRYAHLNYKGLKTLQTKKMVHGLLPQLEASSVTCADCFIGKQHRNPIPKKSEWRARNILELIHADICGPIEPTSSSGRRGGEFNSLNFKSFCKEEGIKRQLTTSYTPHQNGVAERKNRTVMNMVCCMLYAKKVPKLFCTEAANWTFYLLNRCPTHAVKNITPQEAWSGVKPSVEHLRVWGCIANVHILEAKRGKLDDKSFPCIMLGVSDESKGYRLFDPKIKRIVVSKDVVFEEEKSWDWGQNFKEQIDADLVWSDVEFSCDESEGEHIVETNDDSGGEDDGSGESRNETESSRENTTQGRERRAPIWMKDYESGDCLSEEEAETYMVQDVTSNDPTLYEEAVKHEKWRNAMDCEINSI